MKIFEPNFKYDEKVYLALGFFDCIHSGHTKLINAAVTRSRECGALSCVLTFKNNPFTALGSESKLVYTYEERLELLAQCGVDAVLSVDFTPEFMNKSASFFLKQLCTTFKICGLVCGYDYTFGKDKQGNAEFLADFAAKNGIMCDIIPPITVDGRRVSSTLVRRAVLAADFKSVEKLTGRPYFISGEVLHGRGVGKLFNYPTANLKCGTDKLLPPCGVYATYVTVDCNKYRAVTNVGDKPTFGESDFSVESFICGYSGDLYGKRIKAEFVKKLRDIRKFDSPQALGEQINKDAQWR